MPKVGDRIIVKGWAHFDVRVSRIYQEDARGNETKWDFETNRIMLELDWGPEFGKSKVALHDKDKTWFPYNSAN